MREKETFSEIVNRRLGAEGARQVIELTGIRGLDRKAIAACQAPEQTPRIPSSSPTNWRRSAKGVPA